MAEKEKSNVLLDLDSLAKNDQQPSNEDKDEAIKNLRRELEEELVVTSSLTHAVAEKTAEIEHLQVKIGDQEARIYNLEDQIEEWTTQADSCDKLLEQKDCEIEMLQKSLKIEKQQRRDLEDMTMEAGKESILQKETLEKTVVSLQEQIDHMNREKVREMSEMKGDTKEERNKSADTSMPEQAESAETGVEKKAESVADINDEEKKPALQKEEYKADMEVLMDDLFALIKQNEELKEEIDRMKAEQSNMMENSRNVVKELETTIVEKAAEIQQQKHEIRRLSSAIEATDVSSIMESDMDNHNHDVKGELQSKIDDLVSINSELKMRLDEHESTKDSVASQYNKMEQKLKLEREQNIELNKQILEVSKLYDTYYTKCSEMEKGRVKGIDGAFGEQMKGNAFLESPLHDLTEKRKDLDKEEVKVEPVQQESEDNKETISGNDMKKSSSKGNFKLNHQLSMPSDAQSHSRSESVLMLMVNLSKLLLLVSATFFAVTSLRAYYGFSVGQVSSTVFATYAFLYNFWRIFSNGKESRTDDESWLNIAPKLRQAMQDLILRLDEHNFEQFREIYESFLVQSFDEQEQSQPHNLKNEIQYLTSSKNVLAKELTKYKEVSRSVHADYNQLKKEIDVMRMKRVEEETANQKQIQSLKEEIKSMEIQVNKMGMTENAVILNGFMQGSLLKLLLFAVLEGFVLMSASSSFILIPASFISLVLLALIYKTDLHLRYATNENIGYQKTIKELLRKVNKYKEEEMQTSDEVRELEAVVDKDYEIISKQRHAIERLERQLQRAINKYREKKRTLEKFYWLQEQNISNFNGLSRNRGWGHSGVDALFNKTSHSVTDNEGSSKWKWFWFSILGLAVMSYGAVSACKNYDFHWRYTDPDPCYLVAGITIILLALIPIKQKYNSLVKIQNASLKTQLRESRDDQQALLEQIEMLRELMGTEREFVAKLEKEINGMKEVPERKIPKEEVNAVIDRLIEVSKQRDELVVTASSAKDKYDHIKKTLDDILSREKYLSDEVSSLRFQKRELRNDLMKEQLKHIEMYEEVKRLKSHSKKEESCVQDSDKEWEFAIDDFIKESTVQGSEISPENECDIDSESVLESLELAGSYAQKNRKKRTSKRRDKQLEEIIDKRGNDDNTLQPLYHEEVDHKGEQENGEIKCIPEKENKLFGKNENSSEDGIFESVEEQIERVVNGSTDNLEHINNTSRRKRGSEEEFAEDKMSNSMTSFPSNGGEIEMMHSVKVGSEVGEENGSFPLKDLEETGPVPDKDLQHSNLKHLDISDSNISRENSDSGTDCEKIVHFSNADIQSQLTVEKLVKEIFSLTDLCNENEVSLKVELEDVASRPDDLFNFLTDHLILIRYKLLAEKTEMVAKVNSMEEEMEQFQEKIEKLQADIAKEKQARNHVISEYEEEYARLESRLSVAYENIRKRLMEERSLRDEIMVQYEDEIDDMQAKTTKILKRLQEQLMQEKKGKEEAIAQIEGMVKKIKHLEAELTSINEVEKSNQVYLSLQDLLTEESEDIKSEFQSPHIMKLQRLVEEEVNKRTEVLKGKLDEALRNLDECKMKASFDDLIIKRFEKEDQTLRTKMDIQSTRMKDMENEIRNPATMKDVLSWTALRELKAGVIYSISTKNGQSKWENPSDAGIVKVTRSSAGFGNASDVLDEKPMPCSTEDLEDSWFQLDLGQDKSIVPKEYSFCHGWLSHDGCARNWIFEGSVDGDEWHILRRHVMDTSLNDRFMCGSWQLSESKIPFRYLRIRMTGPNSSNTNELYVAGMDVCGNILYRS